MAKALTVTPTGKLTGFVAIEKPSTKFDDAGIYSCQVAFTGKDAKQMKTIIDGLMSDSAAAGKKKGVKKAANAPYTIDNKVLTVKFKQKAQIKSRAGDTFEMKVKVYEADGKEASEDLGLGEGSKVKVAFSSYGWAVAALGAGVTLQPSCVQVIELVKYAAKGGSPFDAVDGFTSAKKNDAPFGDELDTDTSDDVEEGDF